MSDHGGQDDNTMPPAPIITPVSSVDDQIYGLPIDSLYEVTRWPSLGTGPSPAAERDHTARDFIARDLISEETAGQLLFRFTNRLDYFCYGLMSPHNTLESVRSSSSVLTAAVCAVSALHDHEGSDTFRICHAEFKRLVTARMFAIDHSSEDIRALIVGTYWLPHLSYTLLGHAIRVAIRLDYHLAYYAAIKDPQSGNVERARIWYILYVLDHHSSILYGRPALISDTQEPHQQWETFIQTNGFQKVDLRISSQTSLYHVTSKVKDIFGTSPAKSVPLHCFQQLNNSFTELDRWYMVWGDRMPCNAYVG